MQIQSGKNVNFKLAIHIILRRQFTNEIFFKVPQNYKNSDNRSLVFLPPTKIYSLSFQITRNNLLYFISAKTSPCVKRRRKSKKKIENWKQPLPCFFFRGIVEPRGGGDWEKRGIKQDLSGFLKLVNKNAIKDIEREPREHFRPG